VTLEQPQGRLLYFSLFFIHQSSLLYVSIYLSLQVSNQLVAMYQECLEGDFSSIQIIKEAILVA